MAHYDHVGKDATEMFQRANDNASGSVGLLNIAAAYNTLPRKPARSAIFLWTTGEEEGLHGSTYYTENPAYPLNKTVAAINFDMIGRSRRDTDVGASLSGEIDITGKDSIKVIHGSDCPELISLASQACRESGV
jgi:Zn-dependent M28 family amino/carboxypeptidase